MHDLLQWDPDAVSSVSGAALDRAKSHRNGSAELKTLPSFDQFGGATAEVSKEVLGTDRRALDESADSAQQVAQRVGTSCEEVRQINVAAKAIMRTASERPVVDVATRESKVLSPQSTIGMSDTEVAALNIKVGVLQESINALLVRGDTTDARLAHDLKVAIEAAVNNPHMKNTQ